VESWRRDLRSLPAARAYTLVIEEGTPEAFEAYLDVYSVAPYTSRVRTLLERRREMIAWYAAVMIDTPASYEAFLASYRGSDLALTAQRLLLRSRDRSLASLASLPPAFCPPVVLPTPARKTKPAIQEKKASLPTREKKTTTRKRDFIRDEEIGEGPAPRAVRVGPPVSIGIGVGIPTIRRGTIRHPTGPMRTGPGRIPGGVHTHPGASHRF
jgi:hypothetical protein